MEVMELSKVQRLILVNQFLLLEKLYPEEAKYYAEHRTAFENGYKLHYPWAMEHIREELNEERCKEILDILDMYSSIHFSSEKCTNDEITRHFYFKFKGFDANDTDECRLFAYVRYLLIDLDRFHELKYDKEFPDLNSHRPMLARYKEMLARYQKMSKKCNKKHELTEDEIIEILGV